MAPLISVSGIAMTSLSKPTRTSSTAISALTTRRRVRFSGSTHVVLCVSIINTTVISDCLPAKESSSSAYRYEIHTGRTVKQFSMACVCACSPHTTARLHRTYARRPADGYFKARPPPTAYTHMRCASCILRRRLIQKYYDV